MNRNMMVLIFTFIIGIILMSGCVDEADTSGVSSDTTDMVVAVSVLPQAEFVEKIAGDNVEVIVVVPPGADPHSYEPTPGQLKDLSDAKMYAMVGSGLTIEDMMIDKIADLNPDMMVIDCSEGIALKEMEAHDHEEETDGDHHEEESGDVHDDGAEEHDHDHENGLDPHIWTSPANVKIMVETIYEGLVELDPENESVYLENKDAYLAELDALDEDIKATLSDKEGSSFMVYHPAWGYFADHYGLTEVAVEIEGKEPSVKGMQNVIDEANEKGIKVIFVQSGFSTVSAQTIANEIGGEVVEVDPLAKDYIDNLAKVAEAFEKGLA
ncbi:zinc ABC transporter substrate-binding protein [Methanolobus sp. WCC4]|uniref:metal ABC transporter solute-binding protein, Zn/Mn family n=1 Tax=Methanolobus sp. WCC4 TaxID=3125784 RepID=UPI0030FB4BE0